MLWTAWSASVPAAMALQPAKRCNHDDRDVRCLDQGLPHPRVQILVQDRQRCLWIGACRGLARYRHECRATLRPQHPQAPLLKIAVDAGGSVPVAARDGVSAVEGERLRHCIPGGADALPPRGRDVWVGTHGTVLRSDAHRNRLLLALGALGLPLLTVAMARRHNRRQRDVLERQVRERTQALQAANQRLQEASFTDELTQLRNRRYLSLHIPSDIALYRRMAANDEDMLSSGILFALIDIDHFKSINDNGGHHTGDAVLQQMAQLLVRLTRQSDYVVRWGGEEFLLVLRSAPRENPSVAAERLCRAVAAHPFVFDHGRHGGVTCSIGLAEFPFVHDPDDLLGWEQLLVLADRALYQAKARGRNGWASYRPVLGAQARQVLAALQEPLAQMHGHACLTLVHSGGILPP